MEAAENKNLSKKIISQGKILFLQKLSNVPVDLWLRPVTYGYIRLIYDILDIPKTLTKLKGHPLYVAQRHILKYETIFPADTLPIAQVKIKDTHENVYERKYVRPLHTRNTWLQKAKVVRDKRTNKSRGFGFVSFKDPQVSVQGKLSTKSTLR